MFSIDNGGHFILEDNSNIKDICLCGMMISLTILVKLIFNFLPIVNGYPIDVYIVVFIYSLLIIKKRK